MKLYVILLNGNMHGPIPESALVKGFRDGIYPDDTLVVDEESHELVPIASLPIFANPEAKPESVPGDGAPEPSAQKSAKKKWGIIGCAAAVVVVLVVALLLCLRGPSGEGDGGRSFETDDDVMAFLDEKGKAAMAFDAEFGRQFQESLKDLKQGLDVYAADSVRSRLSMFMAACGEKGAMVYLFEKKCLNGQMAQEAFVTAAEYGRIEVIKYFMENQSLMGDLFSADPAFLMAACAGQLETCKYLVDECGADISDTQYTCLIVCRILDMQQADYEKTALWQGFMRGKKMSVPELMDRVAATLEYVLESDPGIDRGNQFMREQAEESPNPKLKELFK